MIIILAVMKLLIIINHTTNNSNSNIYINNDANNKIITTSSSVARKKPLKPGKPPAHSLSIASAKAASGERSRAASWSERRMWTPTVPDNNASN